MVASLLSLLLLTSLLAAQATAPLFQKGMGYSGSSSIPFDSPKSFESLKVMQGIGTEWLCVVFSWYQDSINSTNIQPLSGASPTDAAMEAMVNQARSLNMKILLKPHVEPRDGYWRAWIGTYFDDAAWNAWFTSYKAYMAYYAKLAQKWKAEVFSCGVEMIAASRNADHFRDVVAVIRRYYTGKVTYSANWGSQYEAPLPPHHHITLPSPMSGAPLGEIDTITWIDALDVIGIDAYYFLTTDDYPTSQELHDAWAPIVLHIANISSFWNKNVIFTEIGYRSINGAAVHPGWWNITAPVNLTQQALCYEAVFQSFKSQSWWEGVYWWLWTTDPANGGPQNMDFTPQNKPLTMQVLASNYGNLETVRHNNK